MPQFRIRNDHIWSRTDDKPLSRCGDRIEELTRNLTFIDGAAKNISEPMEIKQEIRTYKNSQSSGCISSGSPYFGNGTGDRAVVDIWGCKDALLNGSEMMFNPVLVQSRILQFECEPLPRRPETNFYCR